ncbi:YrhB domain-containing protein [Streptomyces sp. NPDC057116]|uniref:YrhB domain-containing protein n=1 Tax=Streptomyces sp. NPDC057116 TaxID=3346023 RepID=UPI0036253C6D
MIERDDAVRIVEEELERDYRERLLEGRDPRRLAVVAAEPHELAWIVSWTSREYLHTGDSACALVGNGPYLVDRVDGSLHRIGVLSAREGAWEADYRRRVRGEVVRTAVDDLHDEVRAVALARGRPHAMRILRRGVPALSLPQAVEYVTALLGGSLPAHLRALTASALTPPAARMATVETVRGAGPRRARRTGR